MSEPQTNVETGCAYHTTEGYVVNQFSTMTELPEGVRKAVEEYLHERLGAPFLAKLRFAGGQVLNEERPRDSAVGGKSVDRRVGRYLLHFNLAVPGLEHDYCAQMETDSEGKTTREIALPDVARNPAKGTIVPQERALRTAAEVGMVIEGAIVLLGYERSSDSLVWLVRQTTGGNGSQVERLVAHIDAHTGRFIMWTREELRSGQNGRVGRDNAHHRRAFCNGTGSSNHLLFEQSCGPLLALAKQNFC